MDMSRISRKRHKPNEWRFESEIDYGVLTPLRGSEPSVPEESDYEDTITNHE